MAQLPTPEEQEAARKALHEWADSIRSLTTQRLVEVTQLAILSSCSRLDDFAGWLLAISGGTLGLVIANAEPILRSTDPSLFKVGLYLLIASCLAGIAVRLVSLRISVVVAIARHLERAFNKVDFRTFPAGFLAAAWCDSLLRSSCEDLDQSRCHFR